MKIGVQEADKYRVLEIGGEGQESQRVGIVGPDRWFGKPSDRQVIELLGGFQRTGKHPEEGSDKDERSDGE